MKNNDASWTGENWQVKSKQEIKRIQRQEKKNTKNEAIRQITQELNADQIFDIKEFNKNWKRKNSKTKSVKTWNANIK